MIQRKKSELLQTLICNRKLKIENYWLFNYLALEMFSIFYDLINWLWISQSRNMLKQSYIKL